MDVLASIGRLREDDCFLQKLQGLRQTSTVTLYEQYFNMLQTLVASKYSFLDESFFIDCCIQGFIQEIQEFVQVFSPLSVEGCFKLAKMKETMLALAAVSNKVHPSYCPNQYSYAVTSNVVEVYVKNDKCYLEEPTDITDDIDIGEDESVVVRLNEETVEKSDETRDNIDEDSSYVQHKDVVISSIDQVVMNAVSTESTLVSYYQDTTRTEHSAANKDIINPVEVPIAWFDRVIHINSELLLQICSYSIHHASLVVMGIQPNYIVPTIEGRNPFGGAKNGSVVLSSKQDTYRTVSGIEVLVQHLQLAHNECIITSLSYIHDDYTQEDDSSFCWKPGPKFSFQEILIAAVESTNEEIMVAKFFIVSYGSCLREWTAAQYRASFKMQNIGVFQWCFKGSTAIKECVMAPLGSVTSLSCYVICSNSPMCGYYTTKAICTGDYDTLLNWVIFMLVVVMRIDSLHWVQIQGCFCLTKRMFYGLQKHDKSGCSLGGNTGKTLMPQLLILRAGSNSLGQVNSLTLLWLVTWIRASFKGSRNGGLKVVQYYIRIFPYWQDFPSTSSKSLALYLVVIFRSIIYYWDAAYMILVLAAALYFLGFPMLVRIIVITRVMDYWECFHFSGIFSGWQNMYSRHLLIAHQDQIMLRNFSCSCSWEHMNVWKSATLELQFTPLGCLQLNENGHYNFIQIQLVMLLLVCGSYQQCILCYDPSIQWAPYGKDNLQEMQQLKVPSLHIAFDVRILTYHITTVSVLCWGILLVEHYVCYHIFVVLLWLIAWLFKHFLWHVLAILSLVANDSTRKVFLRLVGYGSRHFLTAINIHHSWVSDIRVCTTKMWVLSRLSLWELNSCQTSFAMVVLWLIAWSLEQLLWTSSRVSSEVYARGIYDELLCRLITKSSDLGSRQFTQQSVQITIVVYVTIVSSTAGLFYTCSPRLAVANWPYLIQHVEFSKFSPVLAMVLHYLQPLLQCWLGSCMHFVSFLMLLDMGECSICFRYELPVQFSEVSIVVDTVHAEWHKLGGGSEFPVVQSFALLRHIGKQLLGRLLHKGNLCLSGLHSISRELSYLYWQTRGHLLYVATCGVVPAHAARLIQVDTRSTPYVSLTVGFCFNHLATAQVCRLVCAVISSSGDSPFMIWAWRLLLIGIFGTWVSLLWRIAWHILGEQKSS